jgi:hypothetical protein
MWCEVQVQTILNHAWSELAHDTIYKKPDLPGGFGGRLMQGIEGRMKKIMREHLLPAGYEFQKVLTDFERLSNGKELFDRDALTELVECDDNNVRHELLERFATYVLPHYDDITGVQAEIRRAIVQAVKQARKVETRPIETPYGELSGKSVEDVVEIAADIIDDLRYQDVDATFDAICDLYGNAESDAERERWIRSAETLAEHNLFVWRQVGPDIQARLVDRIGALPDDASLAVRPVLIAMLHKVLETKVTGTSRPAYDSVAFHRGAVVANDRLKGARAGAIDKLKAMFRTATTDEERRSIKGALSTGCRLPNGDEDLALLIARDCLQVVEFWTEVAPELSFELRQELEEHLLWVRRRNIPRENAASNEALVAAQTALGEAILGFRDRINSDPEFVIYKTLVGFRSVFPPEWDDPGFGHEEKKASRERRIDDLVAQVTPDNAVEWLQRIRRCAATESDDLATFPSFGQFLSKLGASKPEIMWGYLDQLDEHLAAFLPYILDGLDNEARHHAVVCRLQKWLGAGKYVPQIARHLRFATKFDPAFAETVLQVALKQEDKVAVLYLVEAIATRRGEIDAALAGRLFMSAIAFLAARNDSRWADVIWHQTGKDGILSALSADQVGIALDSLIHRKEIDFHAEAVVAEIAERHPLAVIDFFGKRVRLASDNPPQGYSAVPFSLDALQKALSPYARELVSAARVWFDDDDVFFSYRGGQLLKSVFPRWSPEFEQALREEVRSGDTAGLQFVTQIMRTYEGQSFLHDLCKEIVAAVGPGDPLLGEIGIVLESTGMVSGPFGYVEAYEERKALIETWRTDPRERVRLFAERHIHELEQMIGAEQRRSEQELELRKREFDRSDVEGEDKDG